MLRIIQNKTFKRHFINLKRFCTGRATLKERQRQPSEWENKHLQLKLEINFQTCKVLTQWKWKLLSGVRLSVTHGLYSPWNSPGRNTGLGSLSLLQGIFPTQGSNPGLLHCRQILYQLSHKGSPPQLMIKKTINPVEKLAKIEMDISSRKAPRCP